MHPQPLALAAAFLVAAGCATTSAVPSERMESSSAAILAAESGGAARGTDAEMYLRLAKDQFAYSQQLPNPKDGERVDRLLRRAQVDAELSLALTHLGDQKATAKTAIDKVTTLNRASP